MDKDPRIDHKSVIQPNISSDDEPATKPVGGSNVTHTNYYSKNNSCSSGRSQCSQPNEHSLPAGPYPPIKVSDIEAEFEKDSETKVYSTGSFMLDLAIGEIATDESADTPFYPISKLGYTEADRDPSQDRVSPSGRKLHHIGGGYTVEASLSHNEFGDINDLAILDGKSMEAEITAAIRLFITIRMFCLDKDVQDLIEAKKKNYG